MKLFRLVHQEARQNAASFALAAPEGWAVTFAPYEQLRSQEANAAYWAWINEFCDSGRAASGEYGLLCPRLHRSA